MSIFLSKGLITWRISAMAEIECEGGNRCFLYLLFTQGFYACVYEFSARDGISCQLHGEFLPDQLG